MEEYIDDENLVRRVKGMLDVSIREPARLTSECCIYMAPADIRKLNEEAYTPKVVSIGPFHHNYENYGMLHENEGTPLKIRLFKRFMERISPTISLENWIESMKELEPRIRLCYAEPIRFERNDLVLLIIVDAGFILELLSMYYFKEHISWTDEDNILSKPWFEACIRSDLLLLENQLPFFVLDKLFNQAFASQFMSDGINLPSFLQRTTFLELTFHYFTYYNQQNIAPHPDMNIRHFTDLVRIFHLPPPERLPDILQSEEGAMTHLPKATELEKVGVKFRQGTSKCLLDLKFEGRVLEVPCFKAEDGQKFCFVISWLWSNVIIHMTLTFATTWHS